jgi:mono/diheme cytochrome c family protein
MILPILGFGGWLMHRDHAMREAARMAYEEKLRTHERLLQAPPGEVFPVAAAQHGRDVFVATCAACHSADGTGVVGLGKDLTRSWYVASLDDVALHGFVAAGRAADDPMNTTGIAMPPKGGRDDLTDTDLADLVVYVRALQDPRRMPDLPPMIVAAAAPPSEDQQAQALAAAGGDAELAGYIAHGMQVFATTCASCHGKDARGLKGNGKDLVASAFCTSLDDDGLLAFIKKGRDPGDPANTTGIGMPAKGGNPALSDDDLLDVIDYVRSLQKAASAG